MRLFCLRPSPVPRKQLLFLMIREGRCIRDLRSENEILRLDIMEQQIKDIIEKEIKPMVSQHLGNVEFVRFENGVVSVRLEGTCKGCPASELTLKEGIEGILKQKLPSVERVEAVE